MTSPTKHASFAPSSMSRIITCPASWRESKLAPVAPPSAYAIKGSLLHDYTAKILKGLITLDEITELDTADLGYVKDAVEYATKVREEIDNPKMQVEVLVSLASWGLPQVWGTADVIIIDDDNDIIHVIDHKFGHGVQVYASRNPQQMIYAGAAAGYPPKLNNIKLHIDQPPLDHYDTYLCTAEEMKEFIYGEVEDAITEARSDNPSFNPTEDACRFCPASMTCRARYDQAMKAAQKIFSTIDTPPHQLTIAELVDLFDYTESIVKYRSEIAKYLLTKGLEGEVIPGKRIVAGRSNRKWADVAKVQEYLTDEGYDVADLFQAKFYSPAQVEKTYRKLKKDTYFQSLITKNPGKPQLVDEDDKRPDYQNEDQDFFKEV